jgi:hypothetical protein
MPDASSNPATKQLPAVWWWFVLFLVSVALAYSLRAMAPNVCVRPPGTDYLLVYKPVAESILEGRGVVTQTGGFAYRYPPGQSTLLAATWRLADWVGVSRDFLVDFATVALNAATAVLLAWFASHFWDLKWSFLIGVLWAGNPLALVLIPTLGSDVPYITFLIATVACFWSSTCSPNVRYFGLALTGGLLGLALLFRPAGLLVPFVLAAFLMFCVRNPWRQRLTGIVVFLTALLVVIAPWEFEMYRHLGKVMPLSGGGLPSMIDGLVRPKASDVNMTPAPLPPDVDAFATDLRQKDAANEIKDTKQLAAWLVDQTKQRPTAVLKVIGYKLARSWYGTDSRRSETPILLVQLVLLSFAVVGGVRAWRRGGSYRELVVLVLALVLVTWFMSVTVASLVRYMVPVMGTLFLLLPAAFGRFPAPPSTANVPTPNNRMQ